MSADQAQNLKVYISKLSALNYGMSFFSALAGHFKCWSCWEAAGINGIIWSLFTSPFTLGPSVTNGSEDCWAVEA